jgi:uncharacterized protein YdeI (YjbR/CyaY-like superfamily)
MFLFFYGVFFIFDKLKQNNLEKENKWNKTNQWENEIEQLHAIIRKTSLVETTKWGGSVYTHKNKNVLGIGGFKSYFGIWFYNVVFMKDNEVFQGYTDLKFRDGSNVIVCCPSTTIIHIISQFKKEAKEKQSEKISIGLKNYLTVNNKNGMWDGKHHTDETKSLASWKVRDGTFESIQLG